MTATTSSLRLPTLASAIAGADRREIVDVPMAGEKTIGAGQVRQAWNAGVTKLTIRTTYHDKAARDVSIQYGSDVVEDSFDRMEDFLRSLLSPKEPVSG